MNDRWLDAASFMIEDAVAELVAVQEWIEAFPVHSAPAALLRLRAGDLEHRIAAACRVLDAYAHAGAPGEAGGEEGGGTPLPFPAPASATATREAA